MKTSKEATKEITELIRSIAGGTIFGCTFIKRTDGSERTMTCRLGVSPRIDAQAALGDKPPPRYSPLDYGLLSVYDMNKKGYRKIPLENVKRLVIRGTSYEIKPNGQVKVVCSS
jgi:hypothetical protein